jgi:hypothetical protein
MFAMPQLRTRRTIKSFAITRRSWVIIPAHLLSSFLGGWWPTELATRTFSLGSTFIARPSVPTAPVGLIFPFMIGKTLSCRWLIDPRRQHFQIDQCVEIEGCVRHSCSLRQSENKTSTLSIRGA